jgi:HEAT repeat protein
MTPDNQRAKPGTSTSGTATPKKTLLSVENVREAWFRLTAPVVAWRQRAEGEREELYVGDLSSAEPLRRWQAGAVLRRNPLLTAETVAALIDALGDDEEIVAWHAAEALAAQEPGRVFGPLEAALNDPDPRKRTGAAQALGKLGGDAASASLRKRLDDPEPRVRATVADALGRMNDPALADVLLPLLDDPDSEVVRASAHALGQIGNTAAACPIAAVLVQPGQEVLVRRALAAALAHIPHPDAQEPLLQALHDPDPQVRAYAATALGQVGNEQAHAPLQELVGDKSRLIKGTVSDAAKRAIELLERRGRRRAAA